MSKKLYSYNQSIYNQTVQQIKGLGIKEFRTQNQLFIFIENIKNPFLARHRGNSTAPYYKGDANYGPIIDKLLEKGILTKSTEANRIVYTVQNR
jgi:hypothetical protein